jgi:hypothetical protein
MSSNDGAIVAWHEDKDGLGWFFVPKGQEDSAQGFNPISANLIRNPSMGEWLLSRRDMLIVARHKVPGQRCRESVPEGRPKSSSVPQIFVVENGGPA